MYYGTKISDIPTSPFSFSNGREDLTLKLHISTGFFDATPPPPPLPSKKNLGMGGGFAFFTCSSKENFS
jgi:hypothetical protein